MSAPLVFSIRPEFLARIFAGEKRFEFRTRRPSVEPGDRILLYETAPTSMVVGVADVTEVITGLPADVWARTLGRGGIARDEYDRYFADRALAVAIGVDATRFELPIPLPDGQRPPQSWARWRGAWPLS